MFRQVTMAQEYPSPVLALREARRVLLATRLDASPSGPALTRRTPPRGTGALLGTGRRVNARHTHAEVDAVRALFRADLGVDRERPDADPLPSRLAGVLVMRGTWVLVQVRWLGREAEVTAHVVDSRRARLVPARALALVMDTIATAGD